MNNKAKDVKDIRIYCVNKINFHRRISRTTLYVTSAACTLFTLVLCEGFKSTLFQNNEGISIIISDEYTV